MAPAKEHLFGQQQQVLMFKEKKEWLLAATRLVLKRLSVLGKGWLARNEANRRTVCQSVLMTRSLLDNPYGYA